MRENELIKLEKSIKFKMQQIKEKKLLPKDSGIGNMFTLLKKNDEALYDKLIKEYKEILKSL